MTHKKHDKPKVALGVVDRFFTDRAETLGHPILVWPEERLGSMRVEEFTQDGTLVIRAELPGIDPDKDVDISVDRDVLSISVQRREEATMEGRNYIRKEQRYGSFQRDLALPKGSSEADMAATYKDGILEIRTPLSGPPVDRARKIPISRS